MSPTTFDLSDPALAAEATRRSWETPAEHWPAMTVATAHVPAPVAIVSAAALLHNAINVRERARQAAGTRPVPTIRIGSKSIRCRGLIEQLLTMTGYRGVLGYTVAEALFLHQHGIDDIVVGYPTADRAGLARLCADESAAAAITLMVDDPAQLDLIDSVCAPARRATVRVCLDLDLSLDFPGRLPRVGVWRSPLRDPATVRALAETVVTRAGFELVGLLGYEAQVAGVPDAPASRPRTALVRALQRMSRIEVLRRRGETVRRVREVADLAFVNGGGSGSVEFTAADPSVTEVTAGSALTGPHLFDHHRSFRPAPATAFALDVVRLPSPGRATVLGGGWIASGPVGSDRRPQVVWPVRTTLEPLEEFGEVQTPLRTTALHVGDRVWLRHAKGGQLAEHVNDYAVVVRLPTYRGERHAFL